MGEVSKKPRPLNRYQQVIDNIFRKHYGDGVTEFTFERDSLVTACDECGIAVPKNVGDIPYTFRYRGALPPSVVDTQPDGMEWIIMPAGRAIYMFKLVRQSRVLPRSDLVTIPIPDGTPEVIRAYSLDDEQALLAIVRYNRLLDIFLGITTYSLQNHLRTTVREMGQIEIDELYVGIDKHGCHHIIPIQAKGGRDMIGVVQTTQDIAWCNERFQGMRCRAISVQFINDGEQRRIAMFELVVEDHVLRVVEERHYRLVPARDLDRDAIRAYRD